VAKLEAMIQKSADPDTTRRVWEEVLRRQQLQKDIPKVRRELVAAQALRRYVSTPLDNLACLAISVHLQRWPRRYGGYVPATSAGKGVMLQGRIAIF